MAIFSPSGQAVMTASADWTGRPSLHERRAKRLKTSSSFSRISQALRSTFSRPSPYTPRRERGFEDVVSETGNSSRMPQAGRARFYVNALTEASYAEEKTKREQDKIVLARHVQSKLPSFAKMLSDHKDMEARACSKPTQKDEGEGEADASYA